MSGPRIASGILGWLALPKTLGEVGYKLVTNHRIIVGRDL